DPATAGEPVPSMMRAFVTRRSNGRGCGCAATTAARNAAAATTIWIGFTRGIICPRAIVPVRASLRYDRVSPGVRSAMRIPRPPLLLLAIALALSGVAFVHADDIAQSKFAAYLDALRVQAGIPGLAAAIVGPTDLVWESAFGQQDVDQNIKTR